MSYELMHIYGPFSIHSYGVAVAVGLLVGMWFLHRDTRYTTLALHFHFPTIFVLSVIVGILGGRLLYIISGEQAYSLSLVDFFSFWNGGLSMLGCMLSIVITIPLYLTYTSIPLLPACDLIALYTPLFQSIARLGCFFAGCCHGIPTTASWGIVYTDSQSMAPLLIRLHPTQLYSSVILFSIFLFMYHVLQHKNVKPGQLAAAYLILVSTERFIVDFWRDDRVFTYVQWLPVFSFHQWIALFIGTGTLLACILFYRRDYTFSSQST